MVTMANQAPMIEVDYVNTPENTPLHSETSSVNLQPIRNKTEIGYSPSFESFAVFRDATLFETSGATYRKRGGFMRGPKKILRLCLFGLLLPVFLISLPLYVRLILYPPTHVPMAPTDQRLMNGRVSSVWCQAQTVQMNGSFNAFLMHQKPDIRKEFSVHTMQRHIVLKDDFKEYWGFFLQKGSVVNIDMCLRHDGGSLMILRGVNNLKKCAWIGEEDSAELDSDLSEESNESERVPDVSKYIPDGLQIQTPNINLPSAGRSHMSSRKEQTDETSEERRRELDYFIRRVIQISKDSKEILQSLNKNRRPKPSQPDTKTQPKVESIKKHNHLRKTPQNKTKKSTEAKDRIKRFLETEGDDQGVEESVEIVARHPHQSNFIAALNATEDELYKRIFHLPEGLNIERGTFDQTNHENDTSNEEQRSSFSSSEEALLNCEGLLGAIPLYADRSCHGPNSPPSSNVTYKIPATGTYYFVFSSDNEVFDSDLYFNMTLNRVVYDTHQTIASCVNQSECSLSFGFWSHDQAIVEVPEGDWDSSYIIRSKCEPRVYLYLLIIIMVPLFLLLSAMN